MLRYLLGLLLVIPVFPQKLLVVDVDDLGPQMLADHPTDFFSLADGQARRYDRFYTCPVCSPTRATVNYGVRASHPDLQAPWLVDYSHSPYSTPTAGPLVPLAQALAGAGVSTAKIGKWHMSPHDQLNHPLEQGWDSYVGVMSNPQDYYSFNLNDNGTLVPVSGVYLTCLESQQTRAAVDAGVQFISTSYHSIHDPFHVPPAGTYSGPVPTTDYDMGVAMLENLSHELTLTLGHALANGYYVILFGDNGGLGLFGGCKGSPRECGVRTWMYVAGPGIVGARDSSLVASYDIYATVLQFFGIPRGPGMGAQSVSFIPTVMGQPGARQTVFVERYTTNGAAPLDSLWHTGTIGVRFKYRRRFGVDILVDLENNPADTQNLLNQALTPEADAAYQFLLTEFQAWTQ